MQVLDRIAELARQTRDSASAVERAADAIESCAHQERANVRYYGGDSSDGANELLAATEAVKVAREVSWTASSLAWKVLPPPEFEKTSREVRDPLSGQMIEIVPVDLSPRAPCPRPQTHSELLGTLAEVIATARSTERAALSAIQAGRCTRLIALGYGGPDSVAHVDRACRV